MRSRMIEKVLGDHHLEQQLTDIAIDRHQTFGDLHRLASHYIKEIAADIDQRVIHVVSWILSRVFRSLYDRIHIDPARIEELKATSKQGPLILVPNHRSHVDGFLLSYLLHHHGMTVPHIAAGKNLSFWPLGPIFRRGGAYFIRRTFRGNAVYRAVLETYLRVLVESGVSQEVFIEGGRSRSGKLGPPRMGMITLLLTAAQTANIRHMTFVPVAISYNQVIEQRNYIDELRGKEKRNERPSDIIRATKYLRGPKHRYGDIHVRFGTPIHADEIHGSIRERVGSIADHLCYEINRQMVVTPVSLVAASLLSHGRPGVTREEILDRANIFLVYLRHKGSPLADRLTHDAEAALMEGLKHLLHMRLIAFHADHVTPYYSIRDDRRLDLDYVKNGVVHFFASLGMVAAFIVKRSPEIFVPQDCVPEFELCQKLFANEFRFSTHTNAHERIRQLLEYLHDAGALDPADHGRTLLAFTGLIENFVDSYRAGIEALLRMKLPQEERAVIALMEEEAKKMLLLGIIQRPEALSRWNMKNAIQSFVAMGVVTGEWMDESRRHRLITPNEVALKNLKANLERIF